MTDTTAEVKAADIEAIRARLDAATPGPWVAGGAYLHPWEVTISRNLPFIELSSDRNGTADAAFIAHAPEDIKVLTDDLEATRGRLAAALTMNGFKPAFSEPIAALLAEVRDLRRFVGPDAITCPLDHSCDDADDVPCNCWCEVHDVPAAECPTFQLVGSWLAEKAAVRS